MSNTFIPDTKGFVSATKVQSFTSPQQAQVRENIGVAVPVAFSEFLTAPSLDYVNIESGTYTVPNNTTVDTELRGVSRQWIGGLFVRDDSATVNGGTVIQNNAGHRYVRQWDQVNIVPEFFRVGSNGYRNDVDVINAAALSLTNGGVIQLQYGKTYWGKQVEIPVNCTLTGGIIKRIQLASSVLTVQANAGATNITVANASAFRVGMNVQIANVLGYSNTASNDSSHYLVSAVSGNVVTLYVPTAVTMPIGAVLFEHSFQLACSTPAPTNTFSRIVIDGVYFDGNLSQNAHTESWTLNNGLYFGGSYLDVKICNCRFYDMPSECITVTGHAWIEKNLFKNIKGSCVHGSAANVEGGQGVWIVDNKAENVCQSTAAINGHGPFFGFYTQSNATSDVTIKNNKIYDLNNGYIVSHLMPGLRIEGNTVVDGEGVHADIFASTVRDAANIINNTFDNLKFCTFGGTGDVELNFGFNFCNNICTNLIMTAVGNRFASISNNEFRYDSNVHAPLSDSTALYLGGSFEFLGNTVVNLSPSNANFQRGLLLQAYTGLIPEMNVSDNVFRGWRTAIQTNQNQPTEQWYSSFTCDNNTINIPTLSGTRRGINSFITGAMITNNKIHAESASGAVGIFSQGSNTDAMPTAYAGCIKNNIVTNCQFWVSTTWYAHTIEGNNYTGTTNHLSSGVRQNVGVNFPIVAS